MFLKLNQMLFNLSFWLAEDICVVLNVLSLGQTELSLKEEKLSKMCPLFSKLQISKYKKLVTKFIHILFSCMRGLHITQKCIFIEFISKKYQYVLEGFFFVTI